MEGKKIRQSFFWRLKTLNFKSDGNLGYKNIKKIANLVPKYRSNLFYDWCTRAEKSRWYAKYR